MKKSKWILPAILCISLFLSCGEKTDDAPTTMLEGKWEIKQISGGITGGGYTADFDVVEFKNNKYTILKAATHVSSGTFVLAFGADTTLTLTSDHSEQHALEQFKKTIHHSGKELLMEDPCCDLFAYRFTKGN